MKRSAQDQSLGCKSVGQKKPKKVESQSAVQELEDSLNRSTRYWLRNRGCRRYRGHVVPSKNKFLPA